MNHSGLVDLVQITNPEDLGSGLPPSTSEDAGKVLKVDAQGTPGWGEDAMATVDQNYDSTSTHAQSGIAVAQALSNVKEVPAVGSSDDNKVLKATYSGGVGSYSWETAPASVTVDQTYDASSANPQSGTAVAGAISTVKQVPASTAADVNKVLKVNAQGNPEWGTDSTVTVDQTYSASSTNPQSGTAVAGALSTVKQVPATAAADANKVLTVNAQGNGYEWVAPAQASYTAGDGIDISSDVVSAKAGTGLSIGTSTKTGPVTEPQYSSAYTSGNLIVVDSAVLLTSDIINAIDNNETITVVVPQYVDPNTTTAPWFNYTNRYVIGAHNNDSGLHAPLSAPSTSYYGTFTLNKSNIPSDYLSKWDSVKASNTTRLEVMGCSSSSFNGWPGSTTVSALGDYHVFDITTEKTVTIQDAINVDNPLPASTSADEDKVLMVNAQGAAEWATAQSGPTYTAGVGIDITAGVVSADIDDVTIKQATTQSTLQSVTDIRQSPSGGYGVIRLTNDVTSKLTMDPDVRPQRITIHIPGNTFRRLGTGDVTSSMNIYLEIADETQEFGTYNHASLYPTPLAMEYNSTDNYTYLTEQDVVVSRFMRDWVNQYGMDPSRGGTYYFGFGEGSNPQVSNQLYVTANGTSSIVSPVVISETVTSNKIAVANPLPASTSADAGKTLQVTSNGLAWVNQVPIEVVASMPASPTAGVLYIVTGA